MERGATSTCIRETSEGTLRFATWGRKRAISEIETTKTQRKYQYSAASGTSSRRCSSGRMQAKGLTPHCLQQSYKYDDCQHEIHTRARDHSRYFVSYERPSICGCSKWQTPVSATCDDSWRRSNHQVRQFVSSSLFKLPMQECSCLHRS